MSGRFTEIAKRAFSFLEDEGFQLVKSEPRSLRYENTQVFVAVAWDRPGELNVWLGLRPIKGHRDESFSLSDLLNMEQVGKSGSNIPPQVADEGRLEPFLEQLARKMRTHAASALAGDRMYFRRLETFRSAQADAFMRDMKLGQVRSKAEKAWGERNFWEVVRLYESIEQDLSPSEKAKLVYARKHAI